MDEVYSTTQSPDLVGQRFERLVVQVYAYSKDKMRHWECLCDCGTMIIVPTKRLKNKHTKSCGCLNRDTINSRKISHEQHLKKRAFAQKKRRNADIIEARKKEADYHQQWRAEKSALGLCAHCGWRQYRATSLVCDICHHNAVEARKRRSRESIAQGKCSNCMHNIPEENRKLCSLCTIMKRGTPEKRLHRIAVRYGITLDDFKNLVASQGGVCAICKEFVGGRAGRLNIDHCHVTGKVRGLLCHKCNRALGLFNDNISKLEAAIVYLRGTSHDTPGVLGQSDTSCPSGYSIPSY